MMRRLYAVVLVGGTVAAAFATLGAVRAVAGAAHAEGSGTPVKATRFVVWADAPTQPPADLAASDPWLNQYFPSKLQIHVGDKVTFKSRNFHTATFLGSTPRSKLPVVTPDTTSHYAGVVDATGTPFWFNGGPPKFVYNPQVIEPVGSPVVADSAVHNSGNFVFIPKHQYTFTFTKPGTYKMLCLVHAGMQGTIVVKPKKGHIPTGAQVAAATLKQLNRSWQTARSLQSQRPSEPNTVYAGAGQHVVLQAFLPKTLSVRVGATVTWVSNAEAEPHNMSFGPVDYIENLLNTLDQFPVSSSAPNQVIPFVALGSEPPAPYVYTGSNHGNGFLATPAIDKDPSSPPPDRFSVTFTKLGTYHYICMFHGKEMSGDIIVTG
jgi:plastocyanin